MIRAICWKEWREQRTIAIAVFAFGVLALALTAQFADPLRGGSVWTQSGARELMAQGLAYLAGTVCGAMLLADEKEVGTLEFLDTLPARRRALWIGKVVFGLGLAIVMSAALAGIAIALGCVDERISRVGYATVVVLIGLLAFSWGTFGGSVARSTLGAVFQGSLASIVVGVALAVPFVMYFGPRRFGRPFGTPLMTYYAVWVAVGLAASAFVFTAVDRQRRELAPRLGMPAAPRPRRPKRAAGLRALLWLSTRQAVFVLFGSLAAGGVLGASMLAPDTMPVFLWPAATLGLGVLAGVTTLGEEQTRGVARFWAERRLPLGRLWATKVLFHFGIAAAAALVLFLPLWAANPQSPFRTRLLTEMRPGMGRFLLLGLVYGFVVGHLAGMLFRKTVVAGLVSGVVALSFAGLILPSIIAGGAAAWQVWLPAGLLLVTARLLLYPWATERIATRGPILRAIGGSSLAVAVLAAGIAYRVYEIPDVPDRLAESGFEQSLPSFEENEAGRTLMGAVLQFRKAVQDNEATFLRGGSIDPLGTIGRDGRPLGPEFSDPWLDAVFAADWHHQLNALADRPPGVFDDPRNRDIFAPQDPLRELRQMANVLRQRGMQRLKVGDAEAYPRLLRGGLAAVRTGRNKSGHAARLAAFEAEASLLDGLTEWMDQLRGRTDLLRNVLPELVRHDREMPAGTADADWAEQVILRNTLNNIGSWLPARLARVRPDQVEAGGPADAEAELVAFAWSVPWERVRRERLLRVRTHGEVPASWLSDLHVRSLWRNGRQDPVEARELRAQTRRRVAILAVALRLYQLDHGTNPPNLESLLPAYLPAVPDDPFTGLPFRYRLSTGEIMEPATLDDPPNLGERERASLKAALSLSYPAGGGYNGFNLLPEVPPRGQPASAEFRLASRPFGVSFVRPAAVLLLRGDAVVWSVGPDRSDDGGVKPLIVTGPIIPGTDWIIVVPAPRE
jgi:hypothetical protein